MTDDTQYEYDIFISYNQVDEAWADKLAARLKQENLHGSKLKVFFAPKDIEIGDSIPERMEYALEHSRKVVLIITPESMASGWVGAERYATLYTNINERQKRLIPLYRRTCKLPPLLKHLKNIDFRDDEKFEESYRILLTTLQDLLKHGEQSTSGSVASLPPAIPRRPAVGFVQRDDDRGRNILKLLKEELTPENNQLIVLWGRGGAGKTTLAAEAVREMSTTFPDRIVWTSARDNADFKYTTLLNEIAAQLGRADLRTLGTQEKEEQVRALIDDAPTLIVLDNFETIKGEEQELCVRFLASRAPCPTLITTREEINEDEVNNISLDAMLLEEARELLRRLIERVGHPRRFKALDQDKIIQKTEYNPLLLRWVVRQIDLAQKPETALAYLAQGDTDVAERIFDRSFNLERVGDDGRAALLALSLFVPDASREALAEVAGFGTDILRLDKAVENLAAVWLIDTTEEADRLIIRGLTYERSKARLTKNSRSTDFYQQFVLYFLKYAEAHSQTTPEDFDALEAEKDNMLNALDVAYRMEDWQSVMRIRAVLEWFLNLHGYWDEAIQRGEQALQAARHAQTNEGIAYFAHNIAVMYQRRGDLDKARRLYDESLEITKGLGDQSGIAVTLHQLAMIAQNQGEIEEARRLYDESLEIEKRLGNQSGIANSLGALGNVARSQGEIEEARRLYNECLAISKKLSNLSIIAQVLHQLAMIAQDQDDVEEARRLYDESLEIKKRLGNQSGIAITLHQLAMIAQNQGEIEEARRLYDESLEIKKKLGDQSGIAISLHALAILLREQGDLREARRLYEASLVITKKLGDKSNLALIYYNLGLLTEEEGNKAEAVRLWRESLSMFEELHSPYAEMVRRKLARMEEEDS
ncbi:MAG TPA: tetratricopeptide repeat protein [Pyrinomonadaceae bacterium]|jgi:tetratricopeptide (TPR) repeat protein